MADAFYKKSVDYHFKKAFVKWLRSREGEFMEFFIKNYFPNIEISNMVRCYIEDKYFEIINRIEETPQLK